MDTLRGVDAPPFVLLPLDGGRYELRAFSDDSSDPIVLTLNESDGRALVSALGEAMARIDSPAEARDAVTLVIGGRSVTLEATSSGIRITVDR